MTTHTAARRVKWFLVSLISALLLLGSLTHRLPMQLTEVIVVVTGIYCVLLAVEENIWNYPIGIANNVFLFLLLFAERLYGNMGLQVVYLVLGVHGWYLWGRRHAPAAQVSHITKNEIMLLTPLALLTLWTLTWYLDRSQGAVPFLDALSTVACLTGQFLLNRKRVENWLIGAFGVSVFITVSIMGGLYLTAGLFAFYLVSCICGFIAWRKVLLDESPRSSVAMPAAVEPSLAP